MDIQTFLKETYLNNTIADYTWFFGAIILGLIFKRLISRYLSHLIFRLIGKKDTIVGADKFNDLLVKPIGFFIMLSIIFIGSSHIEFPVEWGLVEANKFGVRMILNKGFSLIYVISIFWILLKVIDYVGLILKKKAEETENKMDDQLIPFATEIGRILVLIIFLSQMKIYHHIHILFYHIDYLLKFHYHYLA